MPSDSPRFYPVLVNALVNCLKDIFQEGFYADKVISYSFKNNKKWGKRDRQFLAETIYDMTRSWRWLSVLDKQEWIPANYFLRWATYEKWRNGVDVLPFLQEAFSDKAPYSLPTQDELQKHPGTLAEKQSHTDWFADKVTAQYGEKVAGDILAALNNTASVYLRANTLKTSVGDLQNRLTKEELNTELMQPYAFKLTVRKNVFATQSFKEGFYEVQDFASQKVAPLLDPKAGERVADVCAGAGGKTLHLAMLMQNKGTLLAGDIIEKKIEELKVRARRAGVSNLQSVVFEGTKDLKKHHGKFDAVLIDAPCTGSGVIRRKPDTKWKLKETDLVELMGLQENILQTYSKFVKPGGRMVYATCSIFNDENQGQIDKFLSTHPDFKQVSQFTTRPDLGDEDGFFATLLQKT